MLAAVPIFCFRTHDRSLRLTAMFHKALQFPYCDLHNATYDNRAYFLILIVAIHSGLTHRFILGTFLAIFVTWY